MNLLATILGGRAVRESYPLSKAHAELMDMLGGEASASGERVTYKKAMTLSAFWRGVKLISCDVGKLPLHIYERESGENKHRARDHPAYALLRRKPNDRMTAFTFRQTLQNHAVTRGNAYAYITRDAFARPVSLIPLNPDDTIPVLENGVLRYVTYIDGMPKRLMAENVLHIKGLGFDGLSGHDVIKFGKETMGLSIAARKHGALFFKQGARASVVLKHPAELTPQRAKDLAEQYAKLMEKSFGTVVLEEGMDVHELSFSLKDSQLTDLLKFTVLEIANIIGVPPHKLGDNTRTSYNSLEQENQSYLDEGLDGWLVPWEEEATDKLLTEEEKRADTHFVEFRREAILRADLQARYAAYAIAVQWSLMNPNEVRGRENLNGYEGGDKFLRPMNMQVVGDEIAAGGDVARKALRRCAHDVVSRMIRRLAVHAERAAKDPDNWVAWVDGLDHKHRSVYVDTLRPIFGERDEPVERLAGRFFESIRERMLMAADCSEPELAGRVASEVRLLRSRTSEFADDLIEEFDDALSERTCSPDT